MAFSSVSVVTSSLALKWWVRPKESVYVGEEGDNDGFRAHKETMWSRVSSVLEGVWEGFKSVVPGRGSAASRAQAGYEQLPVEMA